MIPLKPVLDPTELTDELKFFPGQLRAAIIGHTLVIYSDLYDESLASVVDGHITIPHESKVPSVLTHRIIDVIWEKLEEKKQSEKKKRVVPLFQVTDTSKNEGFNTLNYRVSGQTYTIDTAYNGTAVRTYLTREEVVEGLKEDLIDLASVNIERVN